MTIKEWKDKIYDEGRDPCDCIDYFTRKSLWTELTYQGHRFKIYTLLQDHGNGLQYGGKLTPKYIAEHGIEYMGVA